MVQKVKMHALGNDNTYVKIYPETSSSQVIVNESTGKTLDDAIKEGLHTLIEKHTMISTELQKVFNFNDSDFIKDTCSTIVFLQAEPLEEDVEYIVEDGLTITLTDPAPENLKLHVIVFKPGNSI